VPWRSRAAAQSPEAATLNYTKLDLGREKMWSKVTHCSQYVFVVFLKAVVEK